MRQIKFRGKRIDNGEWVYGYLVIDESGANNIVSNYGTSYSWDEVEPETVGQYTGIGDKSGRDIYEGDIVKYMSRERTGTKVSYKRRGYDTFAVESDIEIIGFIKQGIYESLITFIVGTEQVTKYESYFFGEGKRSDRPKIISDSLVKPLNTKREYEVIGDIHSNPELLGVKA